MLDGIPTKEYTPPSDPPYWDLPIATRAKAYLDYIIREGAIACATDDDYGYMLAKLTREWTVET